MAHLAVNKSAHIGLNKGFLGAVSGYDCQTSPLCDAPTFTDTINSSGITYVLAVTRLLVPLRNNFDAAAITTCRE